jgi:hypothetical protein
VLVPLQQGALNLGLEDQDNLWCHHELL